MYRHITTLILSVALTGAIAACSSIREGMEGHKDAVAVAEGYALSIDHAAELIAMATDSVAPTQIIVVDRTIDLWVGYTVLASEFSREDQYSGLDLDPLTHFGSQQDLVWMLRDQMVRERTLPDEVTIREQYERDQPFTRMDTHHILIRVPASANDAFADSLRSHTEAIRGRVLIGEPFEQLAMRYSQDPSSASRGGALGWVRRGQLVPEIDAVLVEMDIGEISEVIRTTFGFHIVKVTGRDMPNFDEVRSDYEEHLMSSSAQDMERAFVDSIGADVGLQITPGSANLVRFSAFSPRLTRLGSAERGSPLVRFRGGKLTFGRWADFVIRGAPNTQAGFSGSDSAGASALLTRLAMNEVMATAALDGGHRLPKVIVDSLDAAAKRDLQGAALSAGFQLVLNRQGLGVPAAVDNAFDYMLVRGRSAQPLDRVSPALRRNGPSVLLHPYRYKQVLQRLRELRGEIESAE